jgi:hypothetical protein
MIYSANLKIFNLHFLSYLTNTKNRDGEFGDEEGKHKGRRGRGRRGRGRRGRGRGRRGGEGGEGRGGGGGGHL